MPYLHLPVQAGSDKILAAMNRRHKADDYRRIIDRLRELRPDIALSGDFIAVGFPGESDRDFCRYHQAGIGYWLRHQPIPLNMRARPGTLCQRGGRSNRGKGKSDRLAALQQLLDAQQLAFNKNEGMTMQVLIEKQAAETGR